MLKCIYRNVSNLPVIHNNDRCRMGEKYGVGWVQALAAHNSMVLAITELPSAFLLPRPQSEEHTITDVLQIWETTVNMVI